MNKPKKKREISYNNLPVGTKGRFKTVVIPLALETSGALKPWVTLEDKAIIEIWNLVYGTDYLIKMGDVECEHFLVVKTLVGGVIVITYFNILTKFRSSVRYQGGSTDLLTLQKRLLLLNSLDESCTQNKNALSLLELYLEVSKTCQTRSGHSYGRQYTLIHQHSKR